MHRYRRTWRLGVLLALLAMIATVTTPALAHGPEEVSDGEPLVPLELPNPSDALAAHTAAQAGIISSGPTAKVAKNLDLAGRGDRLVANATTDVWALDGYAYTGTFNSPCGGTSPDAGVWVWDVSNKTKPTKVGVIPSPPGSRSNDVKVASLNSGDILVHSNERCAAIGPGGFEIYNVDDPTNPQFLAHVGPLTELNPIVPIFFVPGTFNDVGVHNLFLFSQGGKDYVAAVVESLFHNFRIWDITNPGTPLLVSTWGAEELLFPGVGNSVVVPFVFAAVLDMLFGGFGASTNKLLHDITVSADGTKAYLSNWDAGLVLLDISNPSNPMWISTAIDVANGSLDGEVNSHAAWPSEDGSIVVETEEDFTTSLTIPTNFTFQGGNPIPGVATSTKIGDTLQANPGNTGTLAATSLTINAGPLAPQVFPVAELSGNNFPLGAGSVGPAPVVFVGLACAPIPPVPPGAIAVARRGTCSFAAKSVFTAAAGAGAVVIANNQGVPWGGVRIWDYSNPGTPALASTFDTVCSANAEDPSCDPAGTYTVHNVIVETRGNETFAYVSWYRDGMLVLDVTDPYNPVEVARYFDNSPGFVASNGGSPHDYWGVYKETNSPWIYGSDRNGGLRIFKEKGAASAGKGASKKP